MRIVTLLAVGAMALFAVPAKAETPDEWVKLGARVHGGFGAFIPLGIRIGLDAVERLKAQPRSLSVLYYDNPKVPCACFADGVAIATVSSFGQRTIRLASEQASPDKAAVIVIRPRKGGPGLRYTIPMSALGQLRTMNQTLKPRQRYDAVMAAKDLFVVEPVD
ncbi:MAG: formylmethanofuran dehydrogenase subunit E family protein [Beijerinckiaceae bacterium]